jgi:hypothetical protein
MQYLFDSSPEENVAVCKTFFDFFEKKLGVSNVRGYMFVISIILIVALLVFSFCKLVCSISLRDIMLGTRELQLQTWRNEGDNIHFGSSVYA